MSICLLKRAVKEGELQLVRSLQQGTTGQILAIQWALVKIAVVCCSQVLVTADMPSSSTFSQLLQHHMEKMYGPSSSDLHSPVCSGADQPQKGLGSKSLLDSGFQKCCCSTVNSAILWYIGDSLGEPAKCQAPCWDPGLSPASGTEHHQLTYKKVISSLR